MRKIIINFIVITIAFTSVSQEKPDYFLPNDVTYDKNIPTPEQFFNQQIGEWHLRSEERRVG